MLILISQMNKQVQKAVVVIQSYVRRVCRAGLRPQVCPTTVPLPTSQWLYYWDPSLSQLSVMHIILFCHHGQK